MIVSAADARFEQLEAALRGRVLRRTESDLVRRSFAAPLAYVALFLLAVLSTPYAREHRSFTVSIGLALLLLAVARLAVSLRLRGGAGNRALRAAFRTGTFASALAWGTFCWGTVGFYRDGTPTLFLLFLTAGIGASASAALAPDLRLARAYLLLMLLPTALCLVFWGGQSGTALGLTTAVYLAFLLVQLRHQSRAYWEAAVDNALLSARSEELERARTAAEAANQAKTAFLANISHEIRTPLTGVLGSLELLLRGAAAAREERLARTALDSARKLAGLLGEVLDLSKIEAGKMELAEVDFDLRQEVAAVEQVFTARAQQRKGLTLSFEVDGACPAFVRGDPVRLGQVLSNLVDNALKFTETGEVGVRVALEHPDRTDSSDRSERVRLRFTVRDTGIGVTPEVRERIFESFSQADPSTTRRYGGTGLGLTIARHLVELMGGELGLESHVGCGSTFWFEVSLPVSEGSAVPVTQPTEAAPIEEDPRRHAPEGRGELTQPPSPMRELTAELQPSVLLVEDNGVNRELIREMLELSGFRVEEATNGREAVEAFLPGRFELILMDCQMPEIDGYEATRQIRAREGGASRVPIVALTGHALQADREECLEAGMDDYLPKPFSLAKLTEMLGRWITPGG